ncbi:unnamed protein product [Adineta ricciae]|uniref:Uncharacterized protein n=1 Tax=Adineta ricciae TaxID=249248 RepID=A0A816DSD3_ADIRI|nr:unnamed protein product [Adineta ricciae]
MRFRHQALSGSVEFLKHLEKSYTASDGIRVWDFCDNPVELTSFGSQIIASVKLNNKDLSPDALKTSFALSTVPTTIDILFIKEVILQNISIANPTESKITSISALTDFDDVPRLSNNPSSPSIKYSPYMQDVIPLTVVIKKTSDGTVPSNTRLSIIGCAKPTTSGTTAQIEQDTTTTSNPKSTTDVSGTSSQPGQTTQAGQTGSSGQPTQPGQTVASGQSTQPGQTGGSGQSTQPGQTGASGQSTQPGQTGASGATSAASLLSTLFGSTTTQAVSGTTTKQCTEMEAIDETTSKKITITPDDIPQDKKTDFQPTSNTGVSFPSNDKKPTITVNFDEPAEVQSVTIPRDKTQGANVEQFEVTFYSPSGSKLNPTPIKSTDSPKDDKSKPATVDSTKIPSDTPVSKVEITVVKTTDDESPKGVVLSVKACTQSATTPPSTSTPAITTSTTAKTSSGAIKISYNQPWFGLSLNIRRFHIYSTVHPLHTYPSKTVQQGQRIRCWLRSDARPSESNAIPSTGFYRIRRIPQGPE